jgi:hypothetical protein
MSLIGSLLALVVFPSKAKPETRPKEAALADEVRRLEFALNFWRNGWEALMQENERLREQRDTLARELSDMRQRETDRQLYAYAHAQSLQAQQNAALYNQGLQSDFMRNCVPSRAQAFGVHAAEPLPR